VASWPCATTRAARRTPPSGGSGSRASREFRISRRIVSKSVFASSPGEANRRRPMCNGRDRMFRAIANSVRLCDVGAAGEAHAGAARVLPRAGAPQPSTIPSRVAGAANHRGRTGKHAEILSVRNRNHHMRGVCQLRRRQRFRRHQSRRGGHRRSRNQRARPFIDAGLDVTTGGQQAGPFAVCHSNPVSRANARVYPRRCGRFNDAAGRAEASVGARHRGAAIGDRPGDLHRRAEPGAELPARSAHRFDVHRP